MVMNHHAFEFSQSNGIYFAMGLSKDIPDSCATLQTQRNRGISPVTFYNASSRSVIFAFESGFSICRPSRKHIGEVIMFVGFFNSIRSLLIL